MKYSQCFEIINSRPPEKDRSLLIMKRMSKEKRKSRLTSLNNEILNNPKKDNYIVQNSLIDGQVEDDIQIQKTSTLLFSNVDDGKHRGSGSVVNEINLNNNINNIPSEQDEEMNIKKLMSTMTCLLLPTEHQLLLKENKAENQSFKSPPENLTFKNVEEEENKSSFKEVGQEEVGQEEVGQEVIESFNNINRNEDINSHLTQTSGKIDVQNILIENLRYGEHVYYCLNMLTSIHGLVIDFKQTE